MYIYIYIYIFIHDYAYIYIYIYLCEYIYICVYYIYVYLAKHMERKLDSNCTRMLRAVLNKSWRQHPTNQQLYGHLSPISKTIQIRWARHAGHCCKSEGELISNVLLWTPVHGQIRVGQPNRTYLQQLCTDTGCGMEDLPRTIDDSDEWQEQVREIRVSGTWWWYIFVYTCIYVYMCSNISIYTCLCKYIYSDFHQT